MRKFLLLYLLLFSGVLANSQVSFLLDDDLSEKDLVPFLRIHDDKSTRLTLEEVQDRDFSSIRDRNLGYTNSHIWLNWKMENSGREDREAIVVYHSNLIDRLELYEKGQTEPIQVLGDRIPYGNRSIDYRNPSFLLKIPAQSHREFYLKVVSESTIPITITANSPENFFTRISNENMIFGLYFGWMLVMFFYNLFLYISARIKSYLFYVLFIFSLAMFQFILNGFAFEYFWPNWTDWANRSLLIFMIGSTITGLLFTTHFLITRQTMYWLYRFYQVLWAIGAVLLVLCFVLSYTIVIRLATFYAALSAILLLVNGILSMVRRTRTAKIFMLASSVFLVGAFMYSLKSMGLLPDIPATSWTIQIGSALFVALLSFGLADRIKELSQDLKKRMVEFEEVNSRLQSSDNRFRQLFHGVSDIIFVLDENWNFIDVNRSVTRHLGFKPDEIKGKNILEMIFKSKDIKNTYNRIFVMEKLEELNDEGDTVEFQTEFQQKYVMEPKEMFIKLQEVELESKKEILGTASVMVEDILGRYLETERISFVIDNYFRNAEIMSNKLTTHILRFTDMNTLQAVRTSLREIIINAIEHGNLNISFDDKTRAMEEGSYLHFIQNRQEDPRYKDKKIRIDYVLDSKKVAYRITDEGRGFDHKKMMEAKMDDLNEGNLQHGRGIMMTRDVFDIVEYNDKGNQVSLIKYFR